MKVLLVHNRYRFRGGEDAVVENTLQLLQDHGVEARLFDKASADIPSSLPGKIGAVFSGIYSRAAAAEMAVLIRQFRPDVVHAHNLYPLLSPSVPAAARRAGVPVVMTCHNYRLVCPIGVHFVRGAICERCAGGREYWCLLRNCRENRFESAAYALRNTATRMLGLFKRNVTVYIAISEFVKQRLAAAGFSEDRIEVLYNMISRPDTPADAGVGRYAAFTGRLSAEKGVETFLQAAARLPEIPVKIGGVGPLEATLKRDAPSNVVFTGALDMAGLAEFYRNAAFVVVPSVWHEAFGLVAAEAMSHGIPVIAARNGALPELLEEDEAGLLFAPGDAADLADKMRLLWGNPQRRRAMGLAGRERAERLFSARAHFDRLTAIYGRAIELIRNNAAGQVFEA